MNKKILIALVVVLVAAVAGGLVYYFQGGNLQGFMGLKGVTVTSPVKMETLQKEKNLIQTIACTSEWQKIFAGNYTFSDSATYKLNVIKPIAYEGLRKLVEDGCSFKIARREGAGGAYGVESFECDVAKVFSGDGMFICYPPLYSDTGYKDDALYNGVKLSFVGQEIGSVYYVLFDNQTRPLNMEISLYTKK